MMWARRGCSVEASARTAILAPRMLRCRAFARRRKVVRVEGMRLSNFYCNIGLHPLHCGRQCLEKFAGRMAEHFSRPKRITAAARACARIRLAARVHVPPLV